MEWACQYLYHQVNGVFQTTQKQKVKDFESDPTGKTAVDKVSEFIADDNINALSISMTEGRIVLLYEEL